MIDPEAYARSYERSDYLDRTNQKIVPLTQDELAEKRKIKEKERKKELKEQEKILESKIKRENEYQVFLKERCKTTFDENGIPSYEFKHLFADRTIWDSYSLRDFYFTYINNENKNRAMGVLNIIGEFVIK